MNNNVNAINSFKTNYEATKNNLIKNGNSNPTTADIINAMKQNSSAQDSVHFQGGEPQTKYMPPINGGSLQSQLENDSTVQTKYMPPIFGNGPQTKYMPPVNGQ